MQLGKRIDRLMKEKGMNQVKLAQKSGITQQAISNYILNKSKPSYDAILALAKALGMEPNWFFQEDDPDDSDPDESPLQMTTRRTNTNTSPNKADVVLFPSSGKAPIRTKFVVGHWFPMRELPPPIRYRTSGMASYFYGLIFNQLVQWIPPGQPRGYLAKDWKPMKKSWLFQLRQDVKFHDGKPLTVEDVIWSYSLYLQQTPQERWIKGLEAIDSNLIQIHLKSECRLDDIAMPLIIPEGTKMEESAFHPTEWIGTGPFKAVELKPSFWRLRVNPHYFFSKPYFDEIQIREYSDLEALDKALVEGEVHFAFGIYHPGKGYITRTEASMQRYQLHFTLKESLAQNLALRQAIALALDRKALAKAAGLKEPLYSSGPFDCFLNDRLQEPYPPDTEAARQLLKLVPNLKKSVFRISHCTGLSQDRLVAEEIVKQLKDIGIRAEIGESAHAFLATRHIDSLERELVLWSASDRFNLSGYNNLKVDKLVQRYRNSAPTSSQLRELRRLIQKDLPDIPLFYYEIPLTYVKRLRALENRLIFLSCINEIHTWYLEEEAAISSTARRRLSSE